jgi:hypothetical protein
MATGVPHPNLTLAGDGDGLWVLGDAGDGRLLKIQGKSAERNFLAAVTGISVLHMSNTFNTSSP